MSLRLFGTEVSGRSILLSQIHTVIEFAGGVGWITLAISGHPALGALVWFVTLEVEHVLALATGKLV